MYDDVPDEDARPISQAEEITNLRLEIRELRARINEKKDSAYTDVRYTASAGRPILTNLSPNPQSRKPKTWSGWINLKACLNPFDLRR